MARHTPAAGDVPAWCSSLTALIQSGAFSATQDRWTKNVQRVATKCELAVDRKTSSMLFLRNNVYSHAMTFEGGMMPMMTNARTHDANLGDDSPPTWVTHDE
jgi:hypothetical protein